VQINPDEFLLAQSEQRLTAFHIATQGNHVEILNKLCAWPEEAQLKPNELKKEIYTNQRQKWVHCVAPNSKFWQIRGIRNVMEMGYENINYPDELLLAKFRLSQEFCRSFRLFSDNSN